MLKTAYSVKLKTSIVTSPSVWGFFAASVYFCLWITIKVGGLHVGSVIAVVSCGKTLAGFQAHISEFEILLSNYKPYVFQVTRRNSVRFAGPRVKFSLRNTSCCFCSRITSTTRKIMTTSFVFFFFTFIMFLPCLHVLSVTFIAFNIETSHKL